MKTKKLLPILVAVILFSLAVGFSAAGAADTAAKSEKAIEAGKTYDIAAGSCGLYFVNAPEDGKLELDRQDRSDFPLKFMKNVCTVKYTDDNGNLVHSFDGILISYFVLDKVQYDKWNAGDLAFYVYDGGWKTCNASWVAGGAYGRLTCWTGTFDSFGIVDTSEKADEEESKKKAKEPSGEKVAAGQTLDLYEGICGVYVAGLPAGGYVDIDRAERSDYGIKFVKDPCEFTYVDANEKDLAMSGALMIGYMNMNRAQEAAWNAGDLGFFANYGNGWTELSAMVVEDNGTPRVCATMNAPGMFGLVDLTEKPDDDE